MSILDSIRFRLDDPSLYHVSKLSEEVLQSNIDKKFSLRHVRITPGLFPSLHQSIEEVFKSLDVSASFDAFVSADEALNAYCVASKDGVIIWLSSGLVRTLEENELQFVLGHELGHWYLQHHLYERGNDSSHEQYKLSQALSRAAEISADRFGLLAVRDLEVALRAIIKTASGLPSDFLGPSVNEYLQQAKDLATFAENVEEIYASHPPMVVRARALLWFSMSDQYCEFVHGHNDGEPMASIDKRVENDLSAALGSQYAANREEDLKHQVFWTLVNRLGEDGSLDKDDQKIIIDCFGDEYLEKLKAMLHGASKARVQAELSDRAEQAMRAFSTYSKSETRKFLNSNTQIRKALKKNDISLV